MIRTLSAFAGLAIAASSASAAFLGIQFREDKTLPSATGLAGFPATNPRVFNLYAKFDGAGTAVGTPGSVNTVVSVGQSSTAVGIGLNLQVNPGANFYQSPGAAGGNTIGGINLDGAGDDRRFWNTFFSIGIKSYNGDYGPVFGDTSSGDPDFGLVNRDSVGSPALQANDFVGGGWFNSNPPSLQGAAVAGTDGQFEVFLGQFSVKDAVGSALHIGEAPLATSNWVGQIFEGELIVFRQGNTGIGEPSAVEHRVIFTIPSPGSLALFGLAGVAGIRRRRA